MKENTSLDAGKIYQFTFNDNVCSGIYLLDEGEGAFYCNGNVICRGSDASQIERLYSETDLNNTISAMVADTLVITDAGGHNVDFDWREGAVHLTRNLQ